MATTRPPFGDILHTYLNQPEGTPVAAEDLQALLNMDHAPQLEQLLDIYWETVSATKGRYLPDTEARMLQAILGKSTPVVHRFHFLKTAWFRYAAVLLLIAGTATFLYISNHQPPKEIVNQQQLEQSTIQPGGNKAILTLADGSTIVLDSAANGSLASQGNIRIIKLHSGSLAYTTGPGAKELVGYNTVSTPRGGQYQVSLPDGTKVWLNAASSVRFPTACGKERRVMVTGEAYFEVARDAGKPFKVEAAGTDIQVLGTSFNVNAYTNENATRTTLISGSVQVNNHSDKILLKPGHQAMIGLSGIKVLPVDVGKVTAWKNGLFNFAGVGVEELMRQVERWYDVEVVYKGDVPGVKFVGGVQRSMPLVDVLAMLEKMGIHTKLEDRTITILP